MEENKTESTEKPTVESTEKPTEKPAEEPKAKKAKHLCCEDDAFDKALGSPKKKRYLIFLSALSALIAAVALLVSSFSTFFAVYPDGIAVTIGIFLGTFTLVESLGLGLFGFLSLLHLMTGKFRPSLLFPVTAIAVGGGEFLGDLIILASQGYLLNTAAVFTETFLMMFLGGALVALGVLALFAPSILEKMGKIFLLLPYGVTLVYLSIRLFTLINGCTITTLTFTPLLCVVLAAGLIEIVGLIILLGGGKKSLREEKESAETLLAYRTLLEKGVITVEELENEKDKLLH